jgi:hypothetical protein
MLLGRPRSKWDYNIKINLMKYFLRFWTGFDWLGVESSGRLCEHVTTYILKEVRNLLIGWYIMDFSRKTPLHRTKEKYVGRCKCA